MALKSVKADFGINGVNGKVFLEEQRHSIFWAA
jgi:hypothetical protein